MSTKKNNLFRLTCILVLVFAVLSCSTKLAISEKRLSAPVKKIVFNSVFLCNAEKLNVNSAGKWYSGNGKANTSMGEFVINFDFCTAPRQTPFREEVFYNFHAPSLPGDANPLTGNVYASIKLDGKNSLRVEYPEVNYQTGLDLFGMEGQVTGGTGVFMNATGTINSRILTDRTNNSATTSHMGVVYLQ
jgi:hypothetical protein